MSSTIQKQLIIFDFDWSFVDQDTDRWVFEVLAPDLRKKMKELKPTMGWVDLVAQTLEELHSRMGASTKQGIIDAMKILPVHPAMIRGVKQLKDASNPITTFLCLSNSNTVYISEVLKAHGLVKDEKNPKAITLFEEIITNPARWTDEGLLVLRGRADPNKPHSCKVGCQPNMCKGEELTAYLERKSHLGPFERMIYVGDGANDYCPALRLRSQDLLLVRKFRGLADRIKKDGGLQCGVKYWGGAWEVEQIFHELQASVAGEGQTDVIT